jgi:outer membrane protein assembly factor BamB
MKVCFLTGKHKGILVFLVSLLLIQFYGATNSNVGANSSSDDWPMFRHDPAHSGYSSSAAPMTNQTLWSFKTDAIVDLSPVVAGGVVYIAVNDNLYALNALTGSKIWNYTIVGSVAAVANDVVYIGSADHNVYALNASTGGKIWNYTAVDVVSSPTVADGVVYAGTQGPYPFGNVFALNASTGLKIWSYETGGEVNSPPAVEDGIMYIGAYDGLLYALNSSTGIKIWDFTTGGMLPSSPAVANGKVYIGSYDHKVYAINASTGTQIWNYTTGDVIWSSPAVANNVVYIGSVDFNLYALNATNGSKIWSYITGSYPSYLTSSPAVADGVVYIGARGPIDFGTVYALNATTGDKIWSYRTGGDVDSSPAVAGGVVYVGSNDGNVYAFGVSHSQIAVLFAAIFVVVIAVAAVGILIYFKKRKH